MAAAFTPFEPAGTIALDIEIAKPVDEAGGWDATGAMGVGCAVVFEYARGRYRIYDSSELEELQECLDRADNIVTWGGWRFDLPVIYGVDRPDWLDSPYPKRVGTNGKPLSERSRDLLRLAWQCQGLDPDGGSAAHSGWKLDDVAEAILGVGKCNDGAQAPHLFRAGQWGQLITYCLTDVHMLVEIQRFIQKYGFLVNKRGKLVRMKKAE